MPVLLGLLVVRLAVNDRKAPALFEGGHTVPDRIQRQAVDWLELG